MNTRLQACTLAALVLCGGQLEAQTWTSEQEAVLDIVEQSWVEDLAEDSSWIDRLSHPELLSWGSAYPMPRNREASIRWSEYGDENSDALIHTISPVGVAVRGDAAVVHYYATVGGENRQGERETTVSRCTDTLMRDGGAWRYLGWFCFEEGSEDD